MILVIDNYDSFTYNLVQIIQRLGHTVQVRRNDHMTTAAVRALNPRAIVISPGPGNPTGAGISVDVVRSLGPEVPVLGVCLGHQCIAEAYGGKIVRAGRIMHGKVSAIEHDEQTIFGDIPNPFDATRYHSLCVEKQSLPACLEVSARTGRGEIMGVRHRRHKVEGVQFHPESILTRFGERIIENFIEGARS